MPSFTLQAIFDLWSSYFCYEQPPSFTNYLINKQCCYPSQYILRHLLVQISISIFISSILFKVIRHILSVIIHFMSPPTAKIRVITYLTTFELHCLQHVISHSIKHILIYHMSLWCICTIWSRLYQTKIIIVTSSIEK